MITTLKDLLHLKDDYIIINFMHIWYYHTPDTDILLNLKTKQKIILDTNISTCNQLNIILPEFQKLLMEIRELEKIPQTVSYKNTYYPISELKDLMDTLAK